MATVRTVLGDLPATDLGPTDYHEHLFQASPLLLGDELDNEAASGHEAVLLRESGFATMVDATPLGLGARPQALSRISARSGLNVVAATGAHREVHYPGGHWLRSAAEDKLAARFYHDIDDPSTDPDRSHSQLVEAALVANPARLLARFPAPDAASKETHD
jgi:predicted metal-dependent phosphotriesterase family hydrolase